MSWASRRWERGGKACRAERGIIGGSSLLKPKARKLNSPHASTVAPTATPRIIPRSDHIVSRSHISPNALRVLYRLRDAGFMAFFVGGCVRDLLLGSEPKDFDVATSALPNRSATSSATAG